MKLSGWHARQPSADVLETTLEFACDISKSLLATFFDINVLPMLLNETAWTTYAAAFMPGEDHVLLLLLFGVRLPRHWIC